MPAPACSDEEFIELWRVHKSAAKVAKILGVTYRNAFGRRERIEKRMRIDLPSEDSRAYNRNEYVEYQKRHHLGLENGTVIVGSDAHFWPGIKTTAFRGFLKLIRELQPKAVVMNGDVFDGARISRHPRIGWDEKPSVIAELKAVEVALADVEEAAGKARRIWPLGNHDARFETRLANTVPEFMTVKGFTLKDHFPAWEPCWSVWPTDRVVIKHRMKGGIHATHNNTVQAGVSVVTGHLHSLKVTPFSDYGGVRYGVDTGTLADPYGPQFSDYMEDNPASWRSGFVVLTFHKGELLWPEVAHAVGTGRLQFRGQVLDV